MAVQLHQRAAGSRVGRVKAWGRGEANQLAFCLHDNQAFSKGVSAGVLQCLPDAGERIRNQLTGFLGW